MKTQDRNTNLCRVALALIFSFWFLIVGAPPAFCSAIPVDVLWAGMFDNSGQPLEGGKVYTYAAGTTATKTTYLDSSKLTAAANPVILDAYGRAQIYADGFYKFVIKTSDDVTLITIDNLEYTSSVSPTNLSVTNLTSTGATIGSITAMLGTLANMTISSATITLARLISPEIANASMTGSLYGPTISNATFSGGNWSGVVDFGSATISVATPTVATQAANKGYVDNCATPTLNVQPANKGYVDAQIADSVFPSLYCVGVSTFSASTYVAENITVVGGMEALAEIPDSGYTFTKGVSSYSESVVGHVQFTATLAADTIYGFFMKDDSGIIYDMVRTRLPAGVSGGCEVPIFLAYNFVLASGSKKMSVYASSDKANTFSIHHKGAGLSSSHQWQRWHMEF